MHTQTGALLRAHPGLPPQFCLIALAPKVSETTSTAHLEAAKNKLKQELGCFPWSLPNVLAGCGTLTHRQKGASNGNLARFVLRCSICRMSIAAAIAPPDLRWRANADRHLSKQQGVSLRIRHWQRFVRRIEAAAKEALGFRGAMSFIELVQSTSGRGYLHE